MALTLITGRAQTGKTGLVYGALRAARGTGRSPVLLLPGMPDVYRATRELSSSIPLGVRVSTLTAWAREQWILHGDGRRIVDGSVRRALVNRAVEHLDTVRPTVRTEGLVKLLCNGMLDLPAEADGVAHPIFGPVIKEYRRLLKASDLIEYSAALELLGERISGIDGPVVVNRFVGLGRAQVAFLEGLAISSDVYVALTWEAGFPGTTGAEGAVSELARCAKEHVHLESRGGADELSSVERFLFGTGKVDSCGRVVFATAMGPRAEIALLGQILAREISSGTPAGRIGVAFRNLAGRVQSIETILSSMGIPFVLDASRSILTTAYGRAFAAALDLVFGQGGRPQALAFVLSPYSGVSDEMAARLDARWRSERMVDSGDFRASISATGRRAHRIMSLAEQLAVGPVGPSSIDTWQEFALTLLGTAHSEPGGRFAHDAAADTAAAGYVLNFVGEMASVPDTPFRLSDVRSALRDLRIRPKASESDDHVCIAEDDRIRGRRFDVVVFGGLTADELPLGQSEGVGEEIRVALGVSEASGRGETERTNFYSTVTGAREKLYLLRQSSDERGLPLRSSVLWEEMMDLYGEDSDAAASAVKSIHLSLAEISQYAPTFTQGRLNERMAPRDITYAIPVRGAADPRLIRGVLGDPVRLSASQIETYLACPYAWFLKYIALRPGELDPEIGAGEAGTRSHTILSRFYDRLPDRLGVKRMTPELLDDGLMLFDEVADEVDRSSVQAAGVREALVLRAARDRARLTVQRDAHILPGHWILVHEWRFGDGDEGPLEFGGAQLTGSIDRVDTDGLNAVLTDYKSGSTVHGYQGFEKHGLVQLALYAIAWERLGGGDVSGAVYRSLRSQRMRGFWRSDVHGSIPSGMSTRDSVDAKTYGELVRATEARVAEVVDGMLRGAVDPRPGSANACKYCVMRTQCPATRG